MSEDLYRARSKEDGTWVFGAYSEHISGRAFIVNVGIDHIGPIAYIVEVDPETKGQFTGMYDATTWEELTPAEQSIHKAADWQGRMIFEGDILEAHYDDLHPGNATHAVVEWSRNGGEFEMVGWWMRQNGRGHDDLCFGDGKLNRVVGNIHENLALLLEEDVV